MKGMGLAETKESKRGTTMTLVTCRLSIVEEGEAEGADFEDEGGREKVHNDLGRLVG
jgi:hypothetical protein